MRTILLGLCLLLVVSCSNNQEKVPNEPVQSTEKSVKEEPDQKEEIQEQAGPVTLSEEDSVQFYNSMAEKERLVDEFCKCAKKNGGPSSTCRDLIKAMIPLDMKADKMRNKYITNERVFNALNKKVDELGEKFNACMDYKGK